MHRPSIAERTAGIVLGALCIVGAVVFAVWSRSVFAILFAVFMMVLLPISFLRSRRLGEEEMMRRQDKAMKINDDPNEMARWIP